jgi:hypothetical protein
VSDTDANNEWSFVVDQLKEIALRVGGRKCVMIAQITELQKENDTLAKRLEEAESQLLNQTQKTKVGTIEEKHGREGIEAHNS